MFLLQQGAPQLDFGFLSRTERFLCDEKCNCIHVVVNFLRSAILVFICLSVMFCFFVCSFFFFLVVVNVFFFCFCFVCFNTRDFLDSLLDVVMLRDGFVEIDQEFKDLTKMTF